MLSAIIQARMSSTRFPGKVLHTVAGKPLLQYLLEGLSRCAELESILVATSTEASDDSISEFCEEMGVVCIRGPLDDVARRFLRAIDIHGCKAFMRVCADSPLLDHRLVTKAAHIFKSGEYDLVTNVLARTFPKGQSVEIVKSDVFRAVYPRMRCEGHLEHVTSYFYAHREEFSICDFRAEEDFGRIQLSVDTPEDMKRFEQIVMKLEKPHWEYSFDDFVACIAS